RPKCRMPSSEIAVVMRMLPAGPPETKGLRAVMRQPPSAFSARPEPPIQSPPPEESSTMFFSATIFRSGSTFRPAGGWWRRRQAGSHTRRVGAPAPGGDHNLVGVHGKGQRGRAAAMREPAHDIGHLAHLGAKAAQFLRHRGRDQPLGLQLFIVLGHETLVTVMRIGPR